MRLGPWIRLDFHLDPDSSFEETRIWIRPSILDVDVQIKIESGSNLKIIQSKNYDPDSTVKKPGSNRQ